MSFNKKMTKNHLWKYKEKKKTDNVCFLIILSPLEREKRTEKSIIGKIKILFQVERPTQNPIKTLK